MTKSKYPDWGYGSEIIPPKHIFKLFSHLIEGGDEYLVSRTITPITVNYYYERAIKATEDEPSCPEHFEVLNVLIDNVNVWPKMSWDEMQEFEDKFIQYLKEDRYETRVDRDSF